MHKTKEHLETDELLADCLSGTAAGETPEELARRIEASEEDRSQARETLEVWLSAGATLADARFDADKAYERFRHRVAAAAPAKHSHRLVRMTARGWWRAAAVVLLLLLPFAAYRHGKADLKQAFADVVIETPRGAQTKLYLPDGTAVWLNAGSRIVYSQGFGVDDRNLLLEGEGYFEVAKDASKPFKIHTRELELRVAGTKFNFKNYKEDEEVVVDLMEGKVLLQNGLCDMTEVVLNPSERAVLNKRTGNMTKIKTNTAPANAWSRNELFFDEDLLEDIAKELARAYDVKVSVADSLKGRRFYGIFPIAGCTVQEVLDAMSSTGRMNYRRTAPNEYLIY